MNTDVRINAWEGLEAHAPTILPGQIFLGTPGGDWQMARFILDLGSARAAQAKSIAAHINAVLAETESDNGQ